MHALPVSPGVHGRSAIACWLLCVRSWRLRRGRPPLAGYIRRARALSSSYLPTDVTCACVSASPPLLDQCKLGDIALPCCCATYVRCSPDKGLRVRGTVMCCMWWYYHRGRDHCMDGRVCVRVFRQTHTYRRQTQGATGSELSTRTLFGWAGE